MAGVDALSCMAIMPTFHATGLKPIVSFDKLQRVKTIVPSTTTTPPPHHHQRQLHQLLAFFRKDRNVCTAFLSQLYPLVAQPTATTTAVAIQRCNFLRLPAFGHPPRRLEAL